MLNAFISFIYYVLTNIELKANLPANEKAGASVFAPACYRHNVTLVTELQLEYQIFVFGDASQYGHAYFYVRLGALHD